MDSDKQVRLTSSLTTARCVPMSGYTLDQLLAWCHDDRLIDTYAVRGDTVYVQSGSSMKTFDSGNALLYLKSLIRKKSGFSGDGHASGDVQA